MPAALDVHAVAEPDGPANGEVLEAQLGMESVPDHGPPDTGQTTPLPDQNPAGETLPVPRQPAGKLRMPSRGPRVVSIDSQRSVETDADRQRSDLLDRMDPSREERSFPTPSKASNGRRPALNCLTR